MTQEIIKILNPVHLPTQGEWMRIADIVFRCNNETYRSCCVSKLQTRFEEMVRGKECNHCIKGIVSEQYKCEMCDGKGWQPVLLTKDMFVCEVEKPNPETGLTRAARSNQEIAYQAAQSKVWFYLENIQELELIEYANYTFWDMIIMQEYTGNGYKVNFTENFVKKLCGVK